jgi:hypothetical protein
MSLYDLTEFLKLSSALNYNLSAASLNRYNVMMFIIAGKRLDTDDRKDREAKALTMEALNYLFNAYRQKRRRLGPMAVLHPLRATAMYTRALDRLEVVDLLTALFHDVLEDIRPVDFDRNEWEELESQIYAIMERLGPEDEWRLMERLQALTRFESESYYQYIGRMLDRAAQIPDLVQVKLADRLDNTLDMRIELQDPMEGVDFYEHMFQLLFVNSYNGYLPEATHSGTAALNGARRLYQLFKNAVLLSLIRQKGGAAENGVSSVFFDAVCTASLKEAQRTLMHVTGYHFKETTQTRVLLLETMEYCYGGRIDLATKPDGERLLDGLFSSYFGHISSAVRNQRLDLLYQDKPLMIQASAAFLVIFLSFLNDPDFYVRGISTEGVEPT